MRSIARISNFLITDRLTYLHMRVLEGPSPLKRIKNLYWFPGLTDFKLLSKRSLSWKLTLTVQGIPARNFFYLFKWAKLACSGLQEYLVMNFQSWLTYDRKCPLAQRNTLVRALYTGLLCWKLNSDQFSCRYIFSSTKTDKVMH